MATEQKLPTRERRPSMGAPIVDIQGAVGPAGISRPKHKRTATGFGAGEIKSIEGIFGLFCLLACNRGFPSWEAHGSVKRSCVSIMG